MNILTLHRLVTKWLIRMKNEFAIFLYCWCSHTHVWISTHTHRRLQIFSMGFFFNFIWNFHTVCTGSSKVLQFKREEWQWKCENPDRHSLFTAVIHNSLKTSHEEQCVNWFILFKLIPLLIYTFNNKKRYIMNVETNQWREKLHSSERNRIASS